jgi:putative chitinase
MKVTASLLAEALGAKPERAALFADALYEACALYGISDTATRLAYFLAQVGHESGALRHVREIWGPTAAQKTYEGRANLGNTQPGDGERFKGRGLIQTTGRANYARLRDRLRQRGVQCPDFEAEPEALEQPHWAAWSAADYWDMRSINAAADAADFRRATKLVNGATNGLADREARLARAMPVVLRAAGEGPAPVPAPQPLPEVAPTPVPRRSDPIPVDPINAPQGEPMVSPVLIPFALEALKTLVPKLGEMFAGSDNAKRNVQAAAAVIDVATQAIGARNAQEMVETIQADKEAAATVKQAIEQNWYEITDLLIKAGESDEKSRIAAHDRAVALAQLTGGRWLYLLGGCAALILIASYAITGVVILGEKETFSDETKAMLLGQVVIFGFVTVLAFLFGSNIQNRMAADASRAREE